MQTSSSAYRTCSASRSASEWTATVLSPISLHARMIRRAISPRLAMRTLEIMEPASALRFHRKEFLTVLDRLPVLRVDPDHDAVDVGLDLVHQLHRFNDAEHLSLGDVVAHVDEDLRLGVRGAIKSSHDRRGNYVQSCFAIRLRSL